MVNECECGCGQEVKNIFVHGHNTRLDNPHRSYRGGYIDQRGYHRMGNDMAHRRIYERHYKCSLLPTVDIHHIDGNKTNNVIENLEPMWHRDHTIHHDPRKWLGKTFSDEHRRRLSEAALKDWEKRRLSK